MFNINYGSFNNFQQLDTFFLKIDTWKRVIYKRLFIKFAKQYVPYHIFNLFSISSTENGELKNVKCNSYDKRSGEISDFRTLSFYCPEDELVRYFTIEALTKLNIENIQIFGYKCK